MLKPNSNDGVLHREPDPTDWLAGAIDLKEVCDDWTPYLPADEKQVFKNFDSMACVSFSAINAIETQLNFLIKTGRMSVGNIEWLNDNRYLKNGLVELSDRFTAKMSGTTKQGNYMTAVWDSIRNDGVIPDSDAPANEDFKWEDYYCEMPQELKNKGKEFTNRFEVQYEWIFWNNSTININLLRNHIKQAPIQIATLVCPTWNTGDVKACGCGGGHAHIIYKIDDAYRDFDSYPPYRKKLSSDYCIPSAMKAVITERALSKEEIAAGLQRVLLEPIPMFNPKFGVGYPGGRVNWALAHRRNIYNLYITLLKRIPAPQEVDWWLCRTANIDTITRDIKASVEYQSKN